MPTFRQIILLADDSPTMQRLVTQTFADTRYDVIAVNNGDAAIRTFDEIQPNVVLADIYMPGKNGYEVCTYVKAHASHSLTPVILLVGAFDAFEESAATQVGATAYIKKPFEPRALIELVRSVLEAVGDSGTATETPKQQPKPVKLEPLPEVTKSAVVPAVAKATPVAVETKIPESDTSDLLGLEKLFQPSVIATSAGGSAPLSEEEIDRIADRVLRKLTNPVIESIAWDVVPNIAAKIVRDELKK